jgi:hypothetical protein
MQSFNTSVISIAAPAFSAPLCGAACRAHIGSQFQLVFNNENKEAHVAAPALLGHRRHRFVHRRQKSRLEKSCFN